MVKVLLRIDEAADALSISRSTAYELIRVGAIRSVHVGRALRVPFSELEAFATRQAEDPCDRGPGDRVPNTLKPRR